MSIDRAAFGRFLVFALAILFVVHPVPGVQAQSADSGSVGDVVAPAILREFDELRYDGNTAVYNLNYDEAGRAFKRMTQLIPTHPAGYLYLANNLWLETLNQSRRLSASLYTSGSFYSQDREEDESDERRDREFNALIRKAIAVAKMRLEKNPKDVEALYYEASALGLRAGYAVTVKRSFRRAIGDANASVNMQKQVLKLDPNYVDAYMSIGLYEYVIGSLPFFWKALARLAGLKGSKEKGIEHLNHVAREGKYTGDDARVLLMGLYAREGETGKALEIVEHLAGKFPRNFLFGVERGALLYRMGRAAEGDSAFAGLLADEHIAREATDVVEYQWGEARMGAGNYEGSVERFSGVIRWSKSEAGLVTLSHLRAGQALDALGRREEAIARYKTVMKRENVYDSHKVAERYIKSPFTGTLATSGT